MIGRGTAPGYASSITAVSTSNSGVSIGDTLAGLNDAPTVVLVTLISTGSVSDHGALFTLGVIAFELVAGTAIVSSLALMATLPDGVQQGGIVWRMLICGAGFGFFQSPNLRAIMSSAPPGRSGGASGIVATSRLLGQSTGAALVALCFGISAAHGPSIALALGACFAGVSCVISFSRMFAARS